jgi:hypothetical protein
MQHCSSSDSAVLHPQASKERRGRMALMSQKLMQRQRARGSKARKLVQARPTAKHTQQMQHQLKLQQQIRRVSSKSRNRKSGLMTSKAMA